MRFRLVGLLAWLVFGRVFAQSATDLLVAGRMELRGSVIPFYLGEEPQPSAVVRVDRAHRDYQCVGFFKVGVLPIGVLEGVTIQVERPELVAASLARLQQWLDPRGSKRLELRRAKIQVAGSVTNSLEAGRILVAADGRWELLDGIRYDSAETHIHAQRATLQVIGNQSGQIVWQTDPPATNHFFMPNFLKPGCTLEHTATNSLEAGKVQCRASNRWELLDGVRLVSGGNEMRPPRAALQISGQRRGTDYPGGHTSIGQRFSGPSIRT